MNCIEHKINNNKNEILYGSFVLGNGALADTAAFGSSSVVISAVSIIHPSLSDPFDSVAKMAAAVGCSAAASVSHHIVAVVIAPSDVCLPIWRMSPY